MEMHQDKIAAEFLLGKLTEQERAAVERDFFRKTDVFENILIAENNLIDDYISERLSPADRALFENRLLINPIQQQRVEFAKTLLKYTSAVPVEESATPETTWSVIFTRFFFGQPMISYSLATVTLVFVAAAIFWWTSNDTRQSIGEDLVKVHTPSEGELKNAVSNPQIDQQVDAKPNDNSASLKDGTANAENMPKPREDQPSPKRDLTRPVKSQATISTIILTLGSTRSSETAKAFVLPDKISFVNLQLKFENGDFSSYFVVIETVDGQQIWTGKARNPSENNNGKTVTLTVPAHRLGRGDYIITLKGLTKEGTYESVADYSLTIGRRQMPSDPKEK